MHTLQQRRQFRSTAICTGATTTKLYSKPTNYPNEGDNPSNTTTKHSKKNALIVQGKEIHTVMAPMVAQSDYAFRRLVRRHGADLCFTQMFHARNLVTHPTERKTHLDFLVPKGDPMPFPLLVTQQHCLLPSTTTTTSTTEMVDPNQPLATTHGQLSEGECGPLIVQLAGHDPDYMVRAATMLLEQQQQQDLFQGIDVNLGCPQGIARKGRYGAHLMEEDFDLVCTILKQLRQVLPSSVLLSAKIRLPPGGESVLRERIPRLMETGMDFMTIHGRTLYENKVTVGPCHVDMMTKAIDIARSYDECFPMIANGGIETRQDVNRILQETGAAAVMSSEALLEMPNLFSTDIMATDVMTPRQWMQQQFQMAQEYIDLAFQYPPLPGVLGPAGFGSFTIVKGHLFKILYRYWQDNEDLRDQFADTRHVQSLPQAKAVIDELEARYVMLTDKELMTCPSSSPLTSSSWYRRHWKNATNQSRSSSSPLITSVPSLTMDERKAQIRERIDKLRLNNNAAGRNESQPVAL